jgi:glycosyltransferase involved in cell wall biosynthesis
MVNSLAARKLVAVNSTGLIGGAEIVLLRLLDAARGAGWDVEAAVPDSDLSERLGRDGIRVCHIPDLKLPPGPRPVALARAGLRSALAARRIRRVAEGADVVLANGLLTLPAVRLARLDVPVVLFVHDVIDRRDWTGLLQRCRRTVSLAISPSEAAARPVRAVGIPTRVIQNGTPWPVAPAPVAAPDPPVVGEAGVLTPMKGQDLLLDAVARLPRRDVLVELAGDTPPKDHEYADQLRARAGRSDLAGRVRFLGRVPDMAERMRRWSVVALPSVVPEAAPLSLLEAMSLGVPVVATDHGGAAETVDGAGVLVPPGDIDAIASALTQLLDDREARTRCAAAGRNAVSKHFTIEHQERQLLGALDDVIGPRPISITWVVPDLVAGLGGTTSQTLTTAHELSRRGHRVRLVGRRREPGLPRRDVVEGLPVERVGVPGIGALAEKVSLFFLWADLVRHRRTTEAVHVVMYPDFTLSAALAGLHRRTVMEWAGLGDATDSLGRARGVVRSLQRWLRRGVLRSCRNIVLSSELQRELDAFGIDSQIVPVPVDLARFHPPTDAQRGDARARLELANDEFVVVYTGQLRRLKAVDRLIAAFASFVATGRRGRLLIVGGASGTDDACEDDLRAQVRSANLDHHVTFTGRVRAVEGYLWAADAFVLPSEREGLSNSLVEAMACGLACVAPSYPIGAEVLEGAGVVPSDNTPQSLSDALVRLSDDSDARARFGTAAAARARERWNLRRVVDEYERVYMQLAGRSR